MTRVSSMPNSARSLQSRWARSMSSTIVWPRTSPWSWNASRVSVGMVLLLPRAHGGQRPPPVGRDLLLERLPGQLGVVDRRGPQPGAGPLRGGAALVHDRLQLLVDVAV